MNISFIRTITGIDGGTGGGSHSFQCDGNFRLLVVGIYIVGGSISSAPQFNNKSMTQVGTVGDAGSHSYMYYLLNPDPGTWNFINAVALAGAGYVCYEVALYNGVKQDSQPDAFTTNGASQQTLTTTLTTTTDKCWTMLVGTDFLQNTTLSAGTGSTFRDGNGTNNYSAIFDSNGVITPAGNYSMSVVSSGFNDLNGVIMASFKPDPLTYPPNAFNQVMV